MPDLFPSDDTITVEAHPGIGAHILPASADWPAITSLALGVFGLVTAEFLPASLLTAMAADLGVSEGAAGQTVTATAVIGAFAAPSMPLLTRRFDRRWVMLALLLTLVLSNVVAATASNLPALLVSRVMLGIALGGFWSMAGALAMRPGHPNGCLPVPCRWYSPAFSLATVCAAPIGAWMGARWAGTAPSSRLEC